MAIAASVITCTHNPRPEYLIRALAALRAQTLPPTDWELIVVDNASKDPVADRFDLSWHRHGRHVREDELGLTPARLRGIAEAHADLLVFVDDDNLLDPDYLEHAVRIAAECPFLGAWGGQIRPEFETDPPEWTKPYLMMLAIVQFERDVWSNMTDRTTTAPCGAGMCIRNRVAREYAVRCRTDPIRLNLDRKGQSLVSCGDSDMALTACDIGLGTGLFHRLRMTHIIPSNRYTLDYLVRLTEQMAISMELLWRVRNKPKPELPRQRLIGRLISSYHRMRLTPEHRAIHDAQQRGRQRAAETIAQSPRVGL